MAVRVGPGLRGLIVPLVRRQPGAEEGGDGDEAGAAEEAPAADGTGQDQDRPKASCVSFMKTGSCIWGANCWADHGGHSEQTKQKLAEEGSIPTDPASVAQFQMMQKAQSDVMQNMMAAMAAQQQQQNTRQQSSPSAPASTPTYASYKGPGGTIRAKSMAKPGSNLTVGKGGTIRVSAEASKAWNGQSEQLRMDWMKSEAELAEPKSSLDGVAPAGMDIPEENTSDLNALAIAAMPAEEEQPAAAIPAAAIPAAFSKPVVSPAGASTAGAVPAAFKKPAVGVPAKASMNSCGKGGWPGGSSQMWPKDMPGSGQGQSMKDMWASWGQGGSWGDWEQGGSWPAGDGWGDWGEGEGWDGFEKMFAAFNGMAKTYSDDGSSSSSFAKASSPGQGPQPGFLSSALTDMPSAFAKATPAKAPGPAVQTSTLDRVQQQMDQMQHQMDFLGGGYAKPSDQQLAVPPQGQTASPQEPPKVGPAGEVTMNSAGLPMRPGHEHCKFFLKNGYCKFGSTCWYDHPASAVQAAAEIAVEAVLNSRGMPLRPDKPYCAYYLKHNECKFGPECRLNHPEGMGGMGPLPGMGDGALLNETGLPLRPGKEPCPFFAKAGACHFGPACRFDHSGHRGNPEEPGPDFAPKPEKNVGLGGTKPNKSKDNGKPAGLGGTKRKNVGLGGQKSKRPPGFTYFMDH